MQPLSFIETIAPTLSFLPGVEPVTSLVIQGFILSFLIGYLTGEYLPEFKWKIFTLPGIIMISTLLAVDYWTYKGYTTSTYIGNILASNADLMAFFLGLFVIGSAIEWDFPDKWQSFKKVVGM